MNQEICKTFQIIIIIEHILQYGIFNSIFGFLSSTFTMRRVFCCLTLCNIHYLKLQYVDGGFMLITNNKTHQKRITILNFIKGQTETAELIIGTATYS